jgi:hypothetical protein
LGGLLGSKFGAMGLGALAGGLMNKQNPLMGAITGGLGGMGGMGIGQGLMNVGAGVGAAAPAQAAGMVGQGAAIDAGSQAAMLAAQNAGAPTAQLAQYGSQALPAAAPMSAGQQMMAGVGESFRNPAQLGQALGGASGTLSTASMAAAPAMEAMSRPREMREEDPGSIPEYDFAYNPTGYTTTGSEELRQFRPTFTRRAAEGGIMQLARGGAVDLEDGDFIVPADVTSFAGGGSTDAGMIVLAKEIGAEPIKGPGTGLSDDIPARIDGKQPARVANGEMLVRKPGKEGAKKLYAMMDNIREQATGKKKQIKPVNIKKALA